MEYVRNQAKLMWRRTVDKELLMMLLSVAVGIISGIGAWIFRKTVEYVYEGFQLLSEFLGAQENPAFVVILPGIGGILAGIMVVKWAPEAKGHGVPEIIYSVNIENGKMRLRVPFVKIIASAFTIGTGGSAGSEGPIAQIGGGFASYVAEKTHLSPEHSKILVMAGVSGSIAAIFNAPLGGVLFGLEIIPRDKKARSILPLIISSVVGTSIGELILNSSSIFDFPDTLTIQPEHIPTHLLLFLLIGIFTGILSVLWIKGFYEIEDIFEKIPINPILIPAIGGLLVGLIELFMPEVNGLTYAPINQAFSGKVLLEAAIFLILGKFIATSFSIGSGGSGGIFAPTLFMGAMAGSAFGSIIYYFGYRGLPIEFFALLAMAGLFAAATRAPLTAIIMTSEMVGDFQLFLPLMFVVITAWIVSKSLLESDIYVIKLIRRGVNFDNESDLLDEITAGEIMARNPVTVSPKDRLEDVMRLMRETGHTGFPVVDGEDLVGVITEHDINIALDNLDMKDWIVNNVCSKKLIMTYDNCPLSIAFLKMDEKHVNRLPVVDRKGSRKLVGWITRSDVMRAYRKYKTYKRMQEEEEKLFAQLE